MTVASPLTQIDWAAPNNERRFVVQKMQWAVHRAAPDMSTKALGFLGYLVGRQPRELIVSQAALTSFAVLPRDPVSKVLSALDRFWASFLSVSLAALASSPNAAFSCVM
ncbi:hypothetical protein DFP92_11664 [Yoonia sediminilitoris]|uniref:Uncharacterized protein n=1 Tax=Yoonia sediminilitoris TaxID=1286148 RepID=A0A2T6K845_9RHOB|nr:hypothetical protein C8N45_11664 [Yoonia sediminilitoris]RCW90566.1 hypothetical protein DFP92_11664 [Yoonia sediminilitoris]